MTTKELQAIRAKVNWSGYDRSKGKEIINLLLDHIEDIGAEDLPAHDDIYDLLNYKKGTRI